MKHRVNYPGVEEKIPITLFPVRAGKGDVMPGFFKLKVPLHCMTKRYWGVLVW